MGMRGIRVGMMGIRGIMVEMRGTDVGMRGIGGRNERNQDEKWWIKNVERDKNKKECVHLQKYSFNTLVWETITQTDLNTDLYFHKYYTLY